MKNKVLKGWCPRSPRGKLWINWMEDTQAAVISALDKNFQGWKEGGYVIVRVEIKEI